MMIRFAFRRLAERPGFALVAIGTLALGIGVNAAIFSLVQAVLLRPLPYAAPEALVRVLGFDSDDNEVGNLAPGRFPGFRARNPRVRLDGRARLCRVVHRRRHGGRRRARRRCERHAWILPDPWGGPGTGPDHRRAGRPARRSAGGAAERRLLASPIRREPGGAGHPDSPERTPRDHHRRPAGLVSARRGQPRSVGGRVRPVWFQRRLTEPRRALHPRRRPPGARCGHRNRPRRARHHRRPPRAAVPGQQPRPGRASAAPARSHRQRRAAEPDTALGGGRASCC